MTQSAPPRESPWTRAADYRPATLPRKLGEAVLRGIRGRCPRCGQTALFARYLKPAAACSSCAQDWTLHRADDFPPYISIILTGHILAPVIIVVAGSEALPLWAQMGICLAIGAALLVALLQPAKGAVIALQWWMGMHGFDPAGRDEAAYAAPAAPAAP